MANVDIKAADGSNYKHVFRLLKKAMSVEPMYQKDIDTCFKQLGEPFKIRNPDKRHAHESVRFKLNKKESVLYSGSVLTTTVNNLANILIYISFMKNYNPTMTKQEAEHLLVAAAKRAGYTVKCDTCSTPEDLQFLKFSPCANEGGEYDAIINLGVLLRGFGLHDGDIPGRGDMSTRCKIFLSEVIRGWVHLGNHPVMDAFRSHIVNRRGKVVDFNKIGGEVLGNQLGYCSLSSVCARYRLAESDLSELVDTIYRLQIGDVVVSKVVDVIVKKDYGYENVV